MSGRNGLYIFGRVGSGKTFLAACIANALLSDGWTALFMTAADMLGALRQEATAERRGDGAGGLFGRLASSPLLVMDDMGKERPTEWAVETLYGITNSRWSNMLPTIITSNYSIKSWRRGSPRAATALRRHPSRTGFQACATA